MQKVVIEGPVSLSGEIDISGSKNASLPIMISTVLAKGSCLIGNIPNLRDTRFLVSILKDLGCRVDFQKNVFAIHSSIISKKSADYEYVRQMRASIVLLPQPKCKCISHRLWPACDISCRALLDTIYVVPEDVRKPT